METVIFKHTVSGHGPESTHHNHAHFNTRREMPSLQWRRRYKSRGFTDFMSNNTVEVGILSQLAGIDGIEEINVYDSYRLHVEKGEAFIWEEIAPAVMSVLVQYCS